MVGVSVCFACFVDLVVCWWLLVWYYVFIVVLCLGSLLIVLLVILVASGVGLCRLFGYTAVTSSLLVC